MKYNFVIKPIPICSCHSPLRNQSEVISDIIATKEVIVTVDMASKTTLNVTVGSNRTELLVSYIPPGCENLKFHEKYYYNYWTNKGCNRYLFKVLKNQKWNEFTHYVKSLIESLNMKGIDELKVNIIISSEAKNKLGGPEYASN